MGIRGFNRNMRRHTKMNLEGRTGKSVRNTGYRIIGKLVLILMKFISRSVFIYTLGVTYTGIGALFTEMLQMLSLADLGFGTAMVYSMYEPLAHNDYEHIARLVNVYKKVYRIIAVVILIVGIAMIPAIPFFVRTEEYIPHLTIYYVLYLANTIASYLVIYKTCIFTADQRQYILTRFEILFNVLFTAVGCILLLLTRNFIVYLAAQVVFTYAQNFTCSFYASKQYPFLDKKDLRLTGKEEKEIFSNLGSVFIYKLSVTLINSTDNMLISVLAGTAALGYYSNYSMVAASITSLLNMFFQSVIASLGNLLVDHDQKKNYDTFRVLQLISFILSTVVITGIYLLMDDFIRIWLGREYLVSRDIVIAIVVNTCFSVLMMPIWAFRDAAGIYRQTKYFLVATAVLNLLFSILLGIRFGVAGIIGATVLSKLPTYFWYEPILLFRQFFGRNAGNYFINLLKNVIVTILSIVILRLVAAPLYADSWVSLIGKGLVVSLGALAVALVFYYRDPAFQRILKMVRGLVK